MKSKEALLDTKFNEDCSHGINRRKFVQLSGFAIAGGGLLLAGCSNDDDFTTDPEPPGTVFDLGSGNLGILNYAYALEQLEAQFYTEVVQGSYYANANSEEKQILKDVYNHEVIHRDFFKTAISAAVDAELVLPDLEFDFSSIDFGNRSQVLATSVVLEDTGVAAYNGAGKFINPSDSAGLTYLLLAGKIVSVEARHAATFRNLVNPGSTNFADDSVLVNLGGSGKAYDKALPPSAILSAVAATGFIVTEFTANHLPTD